MDSLKSLIDHQKYDLVIKLTEGATEVSDLFYRIAAFSCLGKYEEALFVIQDHQEVLESKLENLIPIHIELLCALDRFDQADSVLNYYLNLPYRSQVVEEILQKMPKIIQEEEKKKHMGFSFSEDDILKLLYSKKDEDVLFSLDLIKTRDIYNFLPDLTKLMVSHPKKTIRSMILILLVQKEVDRELVFLDKTIEKINPKKILQPFGKEGFNKLAKKIDMNYKDQSLKNTAINLLSNLAIYLFPKEISEEDELYEALYIEANNYLGNEIDKISLAKEKALDLEKLNHYLDLLKSALNDVTLEN